MDVTLLIWTLLAVLTCWCVGLYNRLLGLRLQVQQALDQLEPPLSQYAVLLRQHDHLAGYGPDPVIPAQTVWRTLRTSVEALPASSQAARNAPLAVQPLSALGSLIDNISRAWQQLQEQPQDLAGPAIPPDLLKAWQEAEFGVRAARNAFNQLVLEYNAALREYPARLVVWLMGFKVAATL